MGTRARGFSLLEIVVVLVIAAIAIPRMGSAAENSANTAAAASTAELQRAIELYSTEHLEQSPAVDPGGALNTDGKTFIQRLLHKTDDQGNVDAEGLYGPYLRGWPPNPVSGKRTLRIGGALPGTDSDGWRFDPPTRNIAPDHIAGAKVGVITGGAVGTGAVELEPSGP
jgi:prepilin-type N-terminal cleavage/methylation domain-containing protein